MIPVLAAPGLGPGRENRFTRHYCWGPLVAARVSPGAKHQTPEDECLIPRLLPGLDHMATRGETATKRITLDLKDSTLTKLDKIREVGRFGSRNAVIEEMVDEVIEVKEILAKIEHEMKSANLKDQTNVWALAFNMNNAVNEVSRRLARFETKPSK